ncbi:hypothetical protein [Polaribacter sp. SA4-12]|uniref:hypothetical protein n=1 Tax=Polaribacter sp. SA4-12 TaxID=1312072 RepID=UPI000B3BE24B|nr:hypothetical protein [Polaribacter sp. SA4-12]ARV14824.1 hypothetical protein BTO07_06515 [Polaribacter sp. SA4-12]
MERTYIVKNEKFEIEINEILPRRSIFHIDKSSFQRYTLANFDILLTWNKASKEGVSDTFQVIYKGVVLVSIIVTQLQNIVDYLNKFNAISKEELVTLYDEAILNEKSVLEFEIESLKEKKKDLEEKVKLLNQIGVKGKELSELVEKFKDDKV